MTLQTGEKGFTLMELLVVIGIIIVIAGSILTVLPGLREKTQRKTTKAFISRLEIAIEQYYNDNRFYPTGDITNVKTALEPSDSTAKQYIEFDDSEVNGNDIVDYWGNPFVYATPGTQNTGAYDLYSTGADGVTTPPTEPDNIPKGNDPDDINNWSR